MSRNIGFIAMAAVGFGLGCMAGSSAAAEPQREIEEMERKWAEAVEHNDPDEIGNFLSADFTFVNPRGVLVPRAQHLDDFRQKRTVFNKVELTEVVIRVYGDAAVVTSRPSTSRKFRASNTLLMVTCEMPSGTARERVVGAVFGSAGFALLT